MNNWWTRGKDTAAVSMYTLPTIYDKLAIRPTVLKIDIEGFEWRVLDQLTRSTGPPPEQLCLEVHGGSPSEWNALLELLARAGYRLWKVTARFMGVGPVDQQTAYAEMHFLQQEALR